MPPEKQEPTKGQSGSADLVPVTILRDDPPKGVPAIAVTTFVNRVLQEAGDQELKSQDQWVKLITTWFQGSFAAPQKGKE